MHAAAEANVAQRCTAAAARWAAMGAGSMPATDIRIDYRADLHPQGYVLEWRGDGCLRIGFSAAAGLHYALITIEQLIKRRGLEWEHFRIDDEPDFPVRGLMLDIGRNKIPKMETLYALIDRLSELKINHLQLYMEGFCFDYATYSSSFPEETPMGAAEFRELDFYAKSRFIDLVPNQNCLGHMSPWLAKAEFSELAEHPGGLPTPVGFTLPATTLNPTDDRSISLAKDMFDELLPNFSSAFANINMDEPFGLGTGRSKARADEIGVGKLYLEYAEKMFDIVRSHGKKILMWGDVLAKHPEVVSMLPDDVTVLDWNYDSHVSFEDRCSMLQENGVPFYVCPGTSSWSAISGRTDNMLQNISDAARNGKRYGASGLVVTDWGDSGHWPVMAVSYPGYVFAAGASWQVDANLDDGSESSLERYLTDCVFRDRSGRIGKLLLELGRYYHLERSTVENATYANFILNRGHLDRDKFEAEAQFIMKLLVEIGGSGRPFALDYQYDAMQEWLRQRKEELSLVQLDVPDAEVIMDELANTIRLVELGAGHHRYMYRIDLPDAEAEIAWLEHLKQQLEAAIAEFHRLWRIRNREGGLAASAKALYDLLGKYEERLRELKDKIANS